MRVALLVLLVASTAQAWGPTGHRVVGYIAEAELSPAARAEVRRLAPEGLAAVATWADEIKSDPRYTGKAPGAVDTRPWHYLNTRDADDYRRVVAGRGVRHVVDAIGWAEGVLSDGSAPDTERAEALRWLVHLVGDLHQPLHVGFAADRGGNTIEVEGLGGNLHWLWDGPLVDGIGRGARAIADGLSHRPFALPVGDGVDDWALEGIALRGEVYRSNGRPFGPRVKRIAAPSAADRARWGAIVEWRLLLAGHRLAARLEALLGLSDRRGPRRRGRSAR